MAANDRKKVVSHVMDKSHWSFGGDGSKVLKKPAAGSATAAAAGPIDGGADAGGDPGQLVVKPKERARFAIPVPGRGAPEGSLAGLTCVVTGVFPEVGGGEGQSLGKERVKAMLRSFGAKVTSAMSGKT